jgi:hypothetical protein
MKRVGTGVAGICAIAVTASLALVAMGGVAYASSSVTCKKVSGTIKTSFIISSCLPANPKDVTASAPISALATGKGTLIWSPSKQTTMISTKPTVKGQGGCGTGNTEYDVLGTVTGGNSTYTKKGDVVKGRACVNGKTFALSLVPGTVLSL